MPSRQPARLARARRAETRVSDRAQRHVPAAPRSPATRHVRRQRRCAASAGIARTDAGVVRQERQALGHARQLEGALHRPASPGRARPRGPCLSHQRQRNAITATPVASMCVSLLKSSVICATSVSHRSSIAASSVAVDARSNSPSNTSVCIRSAPFEPSCRFQRARIGRSAPGRLAAGGASPGGLRSARQASAAKLAGESAAGAARAAPRASAAPPEPARRTTPPPDPAAVAGETAPGDGVAGTGRAGSGARCTPCAGRRGSALRAAEKLCAACRRDGRSRRRRRLRAWRRARRGVTVARRDAPRAEADRRGALPYPTTGGRPFGGPFDADAPGVRATAGAGPRRSVGLRPTSADRARARARTALDRAGVAARLGDAASPSRRCACARRAVDV